MPDVFAENVSAIDFTKLRKRGFSAIIFDIDNTLESHRTALPGGGTYMLLNQLQQQGFRLCFLSNNSPERGLAFAKDISVPLVAAAGKPSKKGYHRAMKVLGSTPEQTIMIGDQIYTDIWGGNRTGLFTILVKPIEPIENRFFIVKRALEKPVLRRIRKRERTKAQASGGAYGEYHGE